MRHLFSGAFILLGAVVIGGCSNDDLNINFDDENAINFSVTVPRSPRTATTTESINEFSVWAFVDGNKFMDNVTVVKNNNSWQYSPTMYWPADDKAVNFYSISPKIPKSEATVVNTPGTPDITGYTNTDGTTDLLYAVNMDETAGTTSVVKVNFRHALSQLQFNVRRYSSDAASPLRVEVKSLELLNVYSKGNLTMPRQTTGISGENLSSWSSQSEPNSPVIYDGNVVVLDNDNPVELNSTGYMFALPQTLVPSVSSASASVQGACVRVLCAVYDQESGVKLWPSQTTQGYSDGMAYLYFPLSTSGSSVKEWRPGYAYRYNITIGVPAGSSVIDFDVTVDGYKDFGNLDI